MAVGLSCLLGIFISTAAAQERRLEYNRDVRPILADACFACHGPDSAARKAGLRLDQRDIAIETAAIDPGHPELSEMIHRITATDPDLLMPPPATKKILTEDERRILARWVSEGAEYQLHWSFIPPIKATPPAVRHAADVRNPIDSFVLAKLEAAGLSFAPEADRRALARRVSLDLTGLPPEPEAVREFENDRSSHAYETFVDRLLASPAWGEHRGRYWLDYARYADTHGLHLDNYREMWSYRDCVIDAFNQNMPYDRFSIENLAGDLLPDATLDQTIASGFNRCNMTTNEGGVIPEEYLVLYTRDRMETTAQVWLGLTAGCAVCHSHKFDPLSQREFYEMSAFFNNTTQAAKDGELKDTPPVVVVPRDEDRVRWLELSELVTSGRKSRNQRRDERMTDFQSWLVSTSAEAIDAAVLKSHRATQLAAVLEKPAARRSLDELDELFEWWLLAFDAVYQRVDQDVAKLEQEQAAIKARGTCAHVMQEKPEEALAYVLNRGEYDQRLDRVAPGTPAVLPSFPEAFPRNRLGFARWLFLPGQPLTARVAVNRFWQEVFGTGLVKTSGDFGVMGDLPSHPELLDWLAVEFAESGWNVKRLFREIVTSATYRQSAKSSPESRERDPDNRLLSRGQRYRMDAEMIRDSALAASGLLVRTIGGGSVKPYQPDETWERVSIIGSNTREYRQDAGPGLYRRSVYSFIKRTAPPPALEVFNAPNREYCVVRRERTNTPLQALVTLNDIQFVEAARVLAQQAIREGGTEFEDRLAHLGLRLVLREFQPHELAMLRSSLARLRDHYTSHPEAALQLIRWGETAPDRAIPPAELAAWTMLANELMNLDEVLNK